MNKVNLQSQLSDNKNNKNNKNIIVNPASVIGSLGVIYIKPENRLNNNLNVAVEKILTQSIRENMKLIDKNTNKVAKRLSKLYNTGTDNVDIAQKIINIENNIVNNNNNNNNNKLNLEHDGLYIISPTKYNNNNNNNNKEIEKNPMRSSDTIRLLDKKINGKFHIPYKLKYENIYNSRLYSAPNHNSIINKNSPRMWPNETQYSPSKYRKNMNNYSLPLINHNNNNNNKLNYTIPIGDEQFPLINNNNNNNKLHTELSSQSLRIKNNNNNNNMIYGCSSSNNILISNNILDNDSNTDSNSIESLYKKHKSNKKLTNFNSNINVKNFPKDSTLEKEKKLHLIKKQKELENLTNNNDIKNNDEWFSSASTNVTVGNEHFSMHSSNMSTLQEVLLKDGYKKSDISININTNNSINSIDDDNSLFSNDPSSLTCSQKINNNFNKEIEEDIYELIPLSELYENCRIKESCKYHKKVIKNHANWLINGNVNDINQFNDKNKMKENNELNLNSNSSSPYITSTNNSPNLSRINTLNNIDIKKDKKLKSLVNRNLSPTQKKKKIQKYNKNHHRNISLEGMTELEELNANGIIPHLSQEEQNDGAFELWKRKMHKEEIEYKLQHDTSNKNTLNDLIGSKAINEYDKIKEMKNHEYLSYQDQLSDYLQLSSPNHGTKIKNDNINNDLNFNILKQNNIIQNQNQNLSNNKILTIKNPYREGMLGNNSGIPLNIHKKPVESIWNNTSYSKNIYIDNQFSKNFTICTTELLDRKPKQLYDQKLIPRCTTELINPLEYKNAPTKENISNILNDITKKTILTYDTRIVEIGATIKACVDIRHPMPGIAAVMALHRSFIDTASSNPNPCTLTRNQVFAVMRSNLEWQPIESINRLISSYDAQHTGVIRFVRISTALLVGCRPNMSALSGKKAADFGPLVPTECIADLLLLRLMHQMYDECEGGGAKKEEFERVIGDIGVSGMKIEDIYELLSCCATCVQDEIDIENITQDLFTLLYIDIQNQNNNGTTPLIKRELTEETRRIAKISIKHEMLKSLKGISKVTKEQFIDAISEIPDLLRLFGKQTKKFRELIQPYSHYGTIPYANNNNDQFTENYGTQRITVA